MRVMVAPTDTSWAVVDVTQPLDTRQVIATAPDEDAARLKLHLAGWQQVSEREYICCLPIGRWISHPDGCNCDTHFIPPTEEQVETYQGCHLTGCKSV